MKKFSTLLLTTVALVSLSFGQQRITLLEHFTQASCGPCAQQNPALKALLDQNTTKVIPIKYQVSWPGYDPMYEHNPAQIDARVDYYGVSGVPNIQYEGTILNNAAPSALTQAGIDARYAVAAGCSIGLTHSLSSDLTKINISATVTASAAAIPAGYKLHVVVVEKHINFATAPGSNGEKDFYNVCKRMLPSETGTTLGAIAMGGNQMVSLSWDLANIYKLDQLAVVAFVQNDADKSILQAAISEPQALPAGTALATVASITGGGGAPTCNASIAPVVTIKNVATTPITSCTIDYMVGATPGSFNWTGSLAAGATSTPINLPALNATVGLNDVSAKCNNINGTGIGGGALVAPATVAGVLPSSSTISTLMEDFPTTTLAPGYFNYDVSADGRSWFLGNAGGGNRALAVDFYSGGNSTGFVDYMYIPSLNLTGLASSTMNFKVASAPYSATPENDRVQVVVSTDCGATWTSVYDKAGAALNTAALTTSPFQPGVSSGANWRPETVDLTPYVNNANVLIAFKGTSGYGNYAWVDDININSVIGIEDAALANAVSVYPNPSNGVFTIEAGYGQTVGVHVLNQMGQEVVKSFEMNTATSTIDLSNQAAGTYFILINDGDKIASKKVTLTK